MTIFSRKTIATALSAIILSTSIATTFDISSAEATMRNNRGNHGSSHSGRNMAIGMGIIGAIAIISAIQAQNAPPKYNYLKRRCAQYGEWRKLMDNAKKNAGVQIRRGDQAGADSWLRSARRYAKKADQARADCKRWTSR